MCRNLYNMVMPISDHLILRSGQRVILETPPVRRARPRARKLSAVGAMPLTREELESIQFNALADDVPITDEMYEWTLSEACAFFESGGLERPKKGDTGTGLFALPSASIVKQLSRESRTSTESMVSSLSSSPSLSSRNSSPIIGATSPVEGFQRQSNQALPPAWVMLRACKEAVALAVGMPPEAYSHVVETLTHQGDLLFDLRRYSEAAAAYAAALKIAPSDELKHASELADEAVEGGMWFRQLVPGRDIAVKPVSREEELLFGAAASMKNLVYLIGDAHSRECYVVDACWDTQGLVAFAAKHRMHLAGSICTHGHFDHAGGRVPPSLVAMVYGPLAGRRFDGHSVPGLREMGREHGLRLYCHASEREAVAKQCGLDVDELIPLHHGGAIEVGVAAELRVLHTPGHSTGSICLVACEGRGGEQVATEETRVIVDPPPVDFASVVLPPSMAPPSAPPPSAPPPPPVVTPHEAEHECAYAPLYGSREHEGKSELVSMGTGRPSAWACPASLSGAKFVLVGDTIFPGACGRLDLPGCDASAMYDSLRTLRALDGALPVYPGHSFLGECTTIGRERAEGLLRELSKDAWLSMHERDAADSEGAASAAASKTPFFVPPLLQAQPAA